jgi:hypothetical protein
MCHAVVQLEHICVEKLTDLRPEASMRSFHHRHAHVRTQICVSTHAQEGGCCELHCGQQQELWLKLVHCAAAEAPHHKAGQQIGKRGWKATKTNIPTTATVRLQSWQCCNEHRKHMLVRLLHQTMHR